MTRASDAPIDRHLTAVPAITFDAVEADQSVGQVTLSVVGHQARVVISLGPTLRSGEPDAIHDARVATRRLRTALRVFKDAIPPEIDLIGPDVAWLGRALGSVRDADVLREVLERLAGPGAGDSQDGWAAIESSLAERRASAHERLIHTLDSPRHRELSSALVHIIEPRSVPDGERIAAVAPLLLHDRYRSVRKAGNDLDHRSSPDDLHALRIRGKRFRYTIEFVQPLYGKPARKLIKTMKELQDVLGEIHDLDVARAWLRTAAVGDDGDRSAAAAFTMGGLAERASRRSRKLRRRFPGAYRAVQGGWKELDRTMRGD